MTIVILFVAAATMIIAPADADWRMQHQNLATILMGTEMSTPTEGWIGGAQDGTGI